MWCRRIGLLIALILGAAIPGLVSSQTFLSTTTPQALSKTDTPAFAGLTLTGGTVTVSTPVQSVTQTLNNSLVTFVVGDMNVTDTASAAGSILQQWRVGGTAKAFVDKAGLVQSNGLATSAAAYAQLGSNTVTVGAGGIYRALNNAGTGIIGVAAAQSPGVDQVTYCTAGCLAAYFNNLVVPATDNAFDLGISGTARWRSLYLAANATIGGLTANTAIVSGTAGLIQSVAAVTSGVLISGAPPTFSASPQLTALGLNQAAGAAGTLTVNSGILFQSPAKLLLSALLPTISSGFGTAPSIDSNNGASTFRVNVGTGGTATSGVVGMPTATTGWNCFVSDQTTAVSTRQTASTTTSVTFTGASAWTANDILLAECMAY